MNKVFVYSRLKQYLICMRDERNKILYLKNIVYLNLNLIMKKKCFVNRKFNCAFEKKLKAH